MKVLSPTQIICFRVINFNEANEFSPGINKKLLKVYLSALHGKMLQQHSTDITQVEIQPIYANKCT